MYIYMSIWCRRQLLPLVRTSPLGVFRTISFILLVSAHEYRAFCFCFLDIVLNSSGQTLPGLVVSCVLVSLPST